MGGGGSSMNTVDKAYNARMASIAEEQQKWGREMYNFFKYGVPYNPNQKVYTNAAGERLSEADAYKYETVTQRITNTRPAGQLRGKDSIGAINLPISSMTTTKRTDDLKEGVSETTLGALKGYDPEENVSEMDLMQEFYKQAMDFADVDKRVQAAETDVMGARAKADQTTMQELAKMGISPTSGRGIAALRTNRDALAKDVINAQTQAKVNSLGVLGTATKMTNALTAFGGGAGGNG
jgi:hypothetical protein